MDAAQAGTVTVAPNTGLVTVIERFSTRPPEPTASDPFAIVNDPPVPGTNPATRPETTLVHEYVTANLRTVPGFGAAMILQGQQEDLVVYSQWHATASDAVDVPADWSVVGAFADRSDVRLVDSSTYEVAFVAPGTAADFSAATRAHFGIFSVDPVQQEHLLDLARTNAPRSIGTPGLLAINFHRSLDGRHLINLGAWSTFDDGFPVLSAQPGFQKNAEWWKGVAAFRNAWFDVVIPVTT